MRNVGLSLCLLWLIVCPFPASATVNPRIVSEQKEGGLASYILIVPEGTFKKADLLKLANKYMTTNAEVQLLQVGIFTAENVAHDFMGKNVFDTTFSVWKTQVENRLTEHTVCAAVLLKYGSSATLKVRYPNGQIEEIIISGANTFQPNLDKLPMHLQHVSFVNEGFGKGKRLVAHFYCTVGSRVSSSEASKLARSLLLLVGTSRIEVHLREDEWFIFDAHYPWVNLFAQTQVPPTESEAKRSVEFLCKPGEKETCYQVSSGT